MACIMCHSSFLFVVITVARRTAAILGGMTALQTAQLAYVPDPKSVRERSTFRFPGFVSRTLGDSFLFSSYLFRLCPVVSRTA